MVSKYKSTSFWHLIRIFDITLTAVLRVYIWFIQLYIVNIDSPIRFNVHLVTGYCNHTLYQYLVIVVKGYYFTSFKMAGLY